MAGIDAVGRGISQADAKNGGTKMCSLLSRAGVERPPESRAARPVPPFDKKKVLPGLNRAYCWIVFLLRARRKSDWRWCVRSCVS